MRTSNNDEIKLVTLKELAAIILVAYITAKRWKRDRIIEPLINIGRVHKYDLHDSMRRIIAHSRDREQPRIVRGRSEEVTSQAPRDPDEDDRGEVVKETM